MLTAMNEKMRLSIRDSNTMITRKMQMTAAKLSPRRKHIQVASANAALPASHSPAKYRSRCDRFRLIYHATAAAHPVTEVRTENYRSNLLRFLVVFPGVVAEQYGDAVKQAVVRSTASQLGGDSRKFMT